MNKTENKISDTYMYIKDCLRFMPELEWEDKSDKTVLKHLKEIKKHFQYIYRISKS